MYPGGSDFVSLDVELSCSGHLGTNQLEVEGPRASLAPSSSVDLVVNCNKGQLPREGTHVATPTRGLTDPSHGSFCPAAPHPPDQSFIPLKPRKENSLYVPRRGRMVGIQYL